MSIHNRAHEAYKHQIERDFKESNFPQTVNGLLDFLCDDEERGDYRVYHLNDVYEKTTLKQRLNVLWLVPVWWIIAPFKWVVTGKAGVSQHSKVGKWLAKMAGL